MSRRQYYLSTEGNWQSTIGTAILALMNTSGSDRKFTIRSLSVSVSSIMGAAASGVKAALYECTSTTGNDITNQGTRFDSATAFPSGLKITTNGGGNSYSSLLRTMGVTRHMSTAGTCNILSANNTFGAFKASLYGSANASLEDILLNENESVVLMPLAGDQSVPLRVSLTVSVSDKTISWNFFTNSLPGRSIVAVENNNTTPVKVLKIAIADVGTVDTPYLRVVPVGQVKTEFVEDTSKQIQAKVLKVDSSYPDLSNLTIYQDADIIPYGVPEKYISDGSAGSPKGLNYLHTRDFDGPSYRVFMPEMCAIKPGAVPDMLGHHMGMRNTDIGFRSAGICITPGQGIAIVASAETAVGVQAAYSGWPSLLFEMVIDDEPLYQPSITLSGLSAGSDVFVLEAGTENLLIQTDSNAGTSWSWEYDPDVVSSIDIGIMKAGYVPLFIRGLTVTSAGIVLPVAQTVDRNYL